MERIKIGIVKTEIFSNRGNGSQETENLNSPNTKDTIPASKAAIPIVRIRSGLCIMPTLHSTPKASALART